MGDKGSIRELGGSLCIRPGRLRMRWRLGGLVGVRLGTVNVTIGDHGDGTKETNLRSSREDERECRNTCVVWRKGLMMG